MILLFFNIVLAIESYDELSDCLVDIRLIFFEELIKYLWLLILSKCHFILYAFMCVLKIVMEVWDKGVIVDKITDICIFNNLIEYVIGHVRVDWAE